jgi:hypothetical protein
MRYLLCLLACLLACFLLATDLPAREAIPEGESALPEFLKRFGLNGKPTLIQFGKVGSGQSDKGLDRVIELSRNRAVRGLGLARIESCPDANAVADYYRVKVPLLVVVCDGKQNLATALNSRDIPSYVLVDAFGHVRYRGPYPEQIVSWAQKLLEEEADPGANAPFFQPQTSSEKHP